MNLLLTFVRSMLFPVGLLASVTISHATQLPPEEEIAQKSPQAVEIIEAWRDGLAENQAKRTLHIIYWTPSDREPAPEYRERLTRVMTHIQAFYAREMERLGFGPQTIDLDIAEDQLLRIHLVTAPASYADYDVKDGGKIRAECKPVLEKAGIDIEKETIVIFCNMSKWDPDKRVMSQNSPYYATGNHRNGCAWQVDSPILDAVSLDKKDQKLRDGQYGHISLGRYNSIFVGGVAHELGHALGLPHNCQRKDEGAAFGTALMGNGNRSYGEELRGESMGSFLTLAHGLRLTSHPMFSGTVQDIDVSGEATLTDIDIQLGVPSEKAMTVTGKVVHVPGSRPVHAVLAYCDPEGGGNYNATTATAIPDKDGHFIIHCTDLQAGKLASLRLIALYANGDATSHIGVRSPYTFPYSVGKDGKPRMDTWNVLKQFQPVQDAMKSGDNQEGKVQLEKLAGSSDPKVSAIAKRLLASGFIHPAPAMIEANVKSVALADTTPKNAKVGYRRPTYNRLPNAHLPLQASGRVFTSGIYAHAPARHVYALGGRWKKLHGSCGISQQVSGSTVFVIKADGKELWRSDITKPGKVRRFDVELSGKEKLELIVEDGGDGTGSDWSLWLEPTLERE